MSSFRLETGSSLAGEAFQYGASSHCIEATSLVGNYPRAVPQFTVLLAALLLLASIPCRCDASYSDLVESDNPVAYWKLDESSGSTASNAGSLGSVANGTYGSAHTKAQPPLVGSSGTAVRFSGGQVSLSNVNGINRSGPFVEKTIELWFRPNTLTGRQVLYEQGGGTRGLNIYLDGADLYVAGWNRANDDGGGGAAPWASSTPVFVSLASGITTGTDYHVVLVMDGNSTATSGTITGYLNGNSFGQQTGVGMLWNHNAAVIGNALSGTRFHDNSTSTSNSDFDGNIDEVALYNTALTASQVLLHFQQGLVGHWRLNESSGTTAVDQTGYANDGTYVNSPSLGHTGPNSGVLASAAEFNGTDSYVDIPDLDSYSNQAASGITVAAWVNVQALNTDGHGQTRQPIVAKGGLSDWEWSLYVYDNGRAGFSTWQQSGSSHSEISGGSLPIGSWAHVVATFESGVANRVYINGVQVALGTTFSGNAHDGSSNVRIASRIDGQFLNAAISDVRIYCRPLSPDEVSELYGDTDKLVAHWKLDELSGTTAIDSSTSGLDGTYTNGTSLNCEGPYPDEGAIAAEFDGVDDKIAIPTVNFDFSDGMTIAAWIKPSGPGSPYKAIASFSAGSGNNDIWFGWQPSYGLEIFMTDTVAGGTRWAVDYIEPQVGVWEHCVVTIDESGNAKLYRNGEQTGSGFVSLPANVARDQNYIGHSVYNDEFPGCIDDVRVYARPLSAAEISDLYGLVGHWKMNEGTGVTTVDSSGYANNATLSGATWESDCTGNQALAFDGAGAEARTDSHFLPPERGAISYWFRSEGPLSTNQCHWGVSDRFKAGQDLDGLVSCDLLVDGEAGGLVIDDPLHTEQRWYHVLAQYDYADNSFSIYLNGELYRTGIAATAMEKQAANFLTFGTATGSPDYFDGALRDFRVYNRPLSNQEISKLSGLVALWNLDESSGLIAADTSPNGFHGLIDGNPVWTSGGAIDGAIEFETDDGDDRIDVGTFDVEGQEITIIGWVKPEGGGADLGIITKGNGLSLADQYWGMATGGSQDLDFRIAAGGVTDVLARSSVLVPVKWNHFAGTYDGVTMRLYVNGQLVGSQVHAASGLLETDATMPVTIGDANVGGRAFDGRLDNLSVHSRVMCPEEIRGSYKEGVPTGLRIIKWLEVR